MNDSDQPNMLNPDQTIMQAAALAEHLHRSGVGWLPKPNSTNVERLSARFASQSPSEQSKNKPPVSEPTPIHQPSSQPRPKSQTRAIVSETSEPYHSPILPLVERTSSLDALTSAVSGCTACPKLVKNRRQTVFGEGNPEARIAFFGEGPGADEDRTGRPFVGQAGKLLTKMIEACKFRREDVYILNTVKCRPPQNRNPEPEEIANCRGYFEKQLEIIQPEYIICLGAVSAQALLCSKLPVGRLRGKFHAYYASKVVVTYHPAYLLRNPAAKKAAWDDLQMMLRDAGLL